MQFVIASFALYTFRFAIVFCTCKKIVCASSSCDLNTNYILGFTSGNRLVFERLQKLGSTPDDLVRRCVLEKDTYILFT